MTHLCFQMLVGCGEGFGKGAGAEVLGEVGVAGVGLELDGGEREGEQNEGEGDDEVGSGDGGGLDDAVGLALDRGHGQELGGGGWRLGVAEDEVGSDEGGDEGADGVEGLREVEAAGGGGGGTDDGDVGVDGDLDDGHAGGEDDERGEEEGEGGEVRGGKEAEGAEGHDEEADDHGSSCSRSVRRFAGGVAEDEVGGEEEERDGLGLGVVEGEDGFEVGADDVVEAGEEADHEEEGGGDGHGARVGVDLRVVSVTGELTLRMGTAKKNSFVREVRDVSASRVIVLRVLGWVG